MTLSLGQFSCEKRRTRLWSTLLYKGYHGPYGRHNHKYPKSICQMNRARGLQDMRYGVGHVDRCKNRDTR